MPAVPVAASRAAFEIPRSRQTPAKDATHSLTAFAVSTRRSTISCGTLDQSTVDTGRRPSPHAVQIPDGDQPSTNRLGHSCGNAAKWSTPIASGTCSGSVATDQTVALSSDLSVDSTSAGTSNASSSNVATEPGTRPRAL